MYLFYDENNKVNLIYYQEPSQELLQQRYMKVESIPEAEIKDGMQSILMCDGKKIWYEYEAVELTETEQTISALGQELVNLKLELMVMKGGI